MDIKELQKIVLAFRDERDRKQFHNPKDLASAIAIEAGELMEHFLRKSQEESHHIAKENSDVREEFADILSFLLLFADSCNINIEQALLDKIEKNGKKYPIEKAKGISDKYTKL